jgi:hypothetical protein
LLMVAVGCVVILVLFFALRDIVSKRAASRYSRDDLTPSS